MTILTNRFLRRSFFPKTVSLHAKNLRQCLGWHALILCSVVTFFSNTEALASDHADPIDPWNKLRQEGAITDLFVFPITSDDRPWFPFERESKLPLHDTMADVVRPERTDEDRRKIDSIVFILCVRRQLTDSKALKLDPYTYKIHIDYNSAVEFPKSSEDYQKPTASERIATSGYGTEHTHGVDKLSAVEAFARYGGKITHPNEIKEDVVVEFRLNNLGRLQAGYPRTNVNELQLQSYAGIHDDPFIFPAFFGTNIVAMAIKVPMLAFPSNRTDFLIWASSHNGSKQIDHVGRSLRTQNPRFELLNTLHPSKHVKAITDEHVHPSLMRDIALRLSFANLYAYRKWDFAPDVMCLSTRFPIGFPNGRLLTDDVAAILAQHGDTLLYELSYQHNNYEWPRQKTNDGRTNGTENFEEKFPYLLPSQTERAQPPPPMLSIASVMKLILIGLTILIALILSHWLFARWYHWKKLKPRYL